MNVVRGDAQAAELKGLNVMKSQETATTAHAAAVAEPGAVVASEKATSKKGAKALKGAPKGHRTAKGGKPKAASPKKVAKAPTAPMPVGVPKLPREGTAAAKVIAMIQRKGGSTLEAIMDATKWQAHTCRGFMATLTRRAGVQFTSTRRESDKARVYEVVR